MTIGDIRRRYSVRSRSTTRDARGERPNTYTEKFQVWGELPRENAPRLADDTGMRRSESTMRMRVRRRSGFEVGDQFVDIGSGQVMYLTGFHPVDAMRMWTQLLLSESPVAAST
jgi:head-tail adaptor